MNENSSGSFCSPAAFSVHFFTVFLQSSHSPFQV